jgi:hypothetical protein
MNAIICAKYEEPAVLTIEAIEVHLLYLRSGFDSMQAALRALDEKINRANAKIDRVNEMRAVGDAILNEKIDRSVEALNEKIDRSVASLDEKIDGVDNRLTQKIENLTTITLEMRSQLKAVLWVISLAAVISSGISIAKTLEWI